MRNDASFVHSPSELLLKDFIWQEAQRLGMTYHGIYYRVRRTRRRYYPGLNVRKVNRKVVFVREGIC